MTSKKIFRRKMTAYPVKVALLSLGCPKNLVDSEVILGKLDRRRFRIVDSVTGCDIAIVNTCAFVHDAKKESVERILQLIDLKRDGKIEAVVVAGCLFQRFPSELESELREVDAFIGSGDFEKMPGILERVIRGSRVIEPSSPGYLMSSDEPRVSLTPRYYRYLKISEGCDHRCSFCSIPLFRGPHRSRLLGDVVEEAKGLIREGAKEIILTGQDTSSFGRDTKRRFLLADLLRRLDALKGVNWIRVLYAYPTGVTAELMQTIGEARHVCHYLDMSLQHASDKILRAMRRGMSQKRTLEVISRFRKIVPDLAIRSTFIVGFPGETDKDFKALLGFIKEVKFERLGVFIYSQEEGTPAALLKDQVPEKVKAERFDEVMLLQQEISRAVNRRWMGKVLQVLIEGPDEKQTGRWLGRSFMDAPEVDGNVIVRSGKPLRSGCFYSVRITGTRAYDLEGQVV